MSDLDRLKSVITQSNELSKSGDDEKALALLDDSLAQAARENRVTWIHILSHHAALICDSTGDAQRIRKYYEQSLASNPGNSRALYGLAKVLQSQGEIEQARQLATNCYQYIQHSENELDRVLLEMLLDSWPDVEQRQR